MGGIIAGILRGIAEVLKVIFGTTMVQKESKDEVIGKPLDDDEFDAAKRLRDRTRAASRDEDGDST